MDVSPAKKSKPGKGTTPAVEKGNAGGKKAKDKMTMLGELRRAMGELERKGPLSPEDVELAKLYRHRIEGLIGRDLDQSGGQATSRFPPPTQSPGKIIMKWKDRVFDRILYDDMMKLRNSIADISEGFRTAKEKETLKDIEEALQVGKSARAFLDEDCERDRPRGFGWNAQRREPYT